MRKDMVQKNVLKSDLFRYELHRVWVVEATLRPGMKHSYAKRTFYLDEDTWQIAYEDASDSRGAYLISLLTNEINEPWTFGHKARWADFQPYALRRAGTK